ncbi:hypothetical protein GOP47_0015400 [Adiantum capillus-veneris]|uniref:RING-type E3 ubiquitin transferase n=1 Tax=Adiantum capillus-veneris TaxID=13818 RepID=A0A9D4ZBM2_ADICA|nr:hypothetical protein GOP47_0015400 [Adiantum capillus-veneris]
MSSGSGVIAGPEVDMAELDASSSGPLAVDLNLNLGPSFALELALGGQDFEESVPVSRPNWPRFEPGILAGGQEDEVPPMAEEPPITLPLEDQQDSASVHDNLNRFDAGNSNGAFGGDLDQNVREPHADVQRSLAGLLQAFRNVRHTRHPRRPRQVLFAPVQDLVQTQDSSEHGSTSENRAASDTAVSLLLPRTIRSEETPNTTLEIAPSQDSSDKSGKADAGTVGANFECNICLEMATEPVVTCCGHLFCWRCLHKWLHLHSRQKECPVCKGFLSDDAITPIYGRGTGQDTEKKTGSTPPRPHAHRVNGKRRWLDRFIEERLERGSASAGAQVHVDSNEGETSNAADLVLNRLRVAQRLQREFIDERFRMRLHQRLMGRRGGGAFRPPAAATPGPTAQASFVSATPSSDQHRNENVLTRIAINRLETADSLAAIGASMDGLREGLEHMQRTLEIVSTLPTQPGTRSSAGAADAGSSAVARPLLNEPRISPSSEVESHSPTNSTNAELQVETPELPQTSRHRGVGGASGSSDSEPGAMHVRKRRRLN